jgi:hypothetical protein
MAGIEPTYVTLSNQQLIAYKAKGIEPLQTPLPYQCVNIFLFDINRLQLSNHTRYLSEQVNKTISLNDLVDKRRLDFPYQSLPQELPCAVHIARLKSNKT